MTEIGFAFYCLPPLEHNTRPYSAPSTHPTSLPYLPRSALCCASTTMANYSNNSCHYYYSSSSFCCCCVLCFAVCRKISLPLLLSAFNNKFFAWQKKQKHEEVGEKARGKRQSKWERECEREGGGEREKKSHLNLPKRKCSICQQGFTHVCAAIALCVCVCVCVLLCQLLPC